MFNLCQVIFPQHYLSAVRHPACSLVTIVMLFGYVLFMRLIKRKCSSSSA